MPKYICIGAYCSRGSFRNSAKVSALVPETEEFISPGKPTFRVRGKVFAIYTINHHGDGRVALYLVAPRGAQSAFTKMESEVYFVPAYVGHRGWLGLQLNKGLRWETIIGHVVDAYREVAPTQLVSKIAMEFRVRMFSPLCDAK